MARPEGHAEDLTFRVPAIDCDVCATTIKRGLADVAGVGPVEVDVRSRQVRVRYDPGQVTPAQVQDALEDTGFAVEP